MRQTREDRSQTKFIRFDSRKCEACWQCVEACPRKVFGKINILIHKHAKLVKCELCTGCGKCMTACIHGAITRKEK